MAKNILLVEDDQFLSALLKNRLVKEGLEVTAAKDSNEAMTALRQPSGAQPDLILMDIILPGKSGFETIELIKSEPAASQVPVMIISNLGQESDVARGKQLGVVDYFVKAQTSIDDLVRKIKEFLAPAPN